MKKGQKRPNAQNGQFLKYAQICNCGHFLQRLRTILKYEKILKMGNFEIMDNVEEMDNFKEMDNFEIMDNLQGIIENKF